MRIQRFLLTAVMALWGLGVVTFSGCRDEAKIQVVKVPVEYSERRGPPPSMGIPGAASPSSGETGSSELDYTTPEGWTIGPNKPFRVVSFEVVDGDSKGEVTVSKLGPDQPMLANVNRWRGQIGLTDVAESDLDLKPIDCGGKSGSLVELVGETKTILAVTISLPDATWFLKLDGPKALAQREREKFIAFAQSIKIP